MSSQTRKTFGTINAARKIGIEMHRLYCWEQHGIVRPVMRIFGTRKFRRYSEEDIERAILVKLLVDKEGYTLRAAARKLEERYRSAGGDRFTLKKGDRLVSKIVTEDMVPREFRNQGVSAKRYKKERRAKNEY